MPSLVYEAEIEFEVLCTCGRELDPDVRQELRGNSITVEPCEDCIGKAHSDGYSEAEHEMEI